MANMTLDQARTINRRVVRAYMACTAGDPVPDVSDVTMAEAIAAADIVVQHGECVVDSSRLFKLARHLNVVVG